MVKLAKPSPFQLHTMTLTHTIHTHPIAPYFSPTPCHQSFLGHCSWPVQKPKLRWWLRWQWRWLLLREPGGQSGGRQGGSSPAGQPPHPFVSERLRPWKRCSQLAAMATAGLGNYSSWSGQISPACTCSFFSLSG